MASVAPYQFASKAYTAQFPSQAAADKSWGAADVLRTSCLGYLRNFDKASWYDRPVVSVLNGKILSGGKSQKTLDAFGVENGSQILATDAQAKQVLHHIHNYKPPKHNYLAEFE